ncbi:SafA/ExsA family spore coat assembly protein [Bacillus solimangrovi]|uniref:LysM domain-containing protein n=1 Tax=Bacillus solimangrovi TaxID=1305675 RepID=A0A1E5LBL5_9BACI|nr:SafA/ExsA family spore coat assembly protein [Bacillus solimangrovi]OEH91478.1 hypothetical protein BFG57_05015 [Bacillus solimangrovi]
MKIHIVQKGDTLWKLSQKYGVDFEKLKQANSHLSNPDMIMPGMKIKVPTSSVPVKTEQMQPSITNKSYNFAISTEKGLPKMKEMKKPPKVKEVVKEKKKEVVKPAVQPPMPMVMPMPHTPEMQQQMYANYTFNLPPYPMMPMPMHTPVESSSPMESVAVKEEAVQEVAEEKEMPPVPMMAYPYGCVPTSPVLPGTGLPYGYCGGYPQPVNPMFQAMMPPYGYAPVMGEVAGNMHNNGMMHQYGEEQVMGEATGEPYGNGMMPPYGGYQGVSPMMPQPGYGQMPYMPQPGYGPMPYMPQADCGCHDGGMMGNYGQYARSNNYYEDESE